MSEIDYFTSHVEKLEKEEQDKSKVSRRKEITKTRAGVSDVANRKTMNKASAIVSPCFEKSNQIRLQPDRSGEREKIEGANLRNDRGASLEI